MEFYNPAKPTFEQVIDETQKLIDGGQIDELGGLMRTWVDTRTKSEEEVIEMYHKIYAEKPDPIIPVIGDEDEENVESDEVMDESDKEEDDE